MKKILLLVCFFILENFFSNNVFAVNLAKWELIENGLSTETNIEKIESADFIFGDGVGHKKFDSNGAFGTSLQTLELDETAYFEFQISPMLGEILNISQVNFEERRSEKGAPNFQVESSRDGSFLDNEILYSGSGSYLDPEAHTLRNIDNLNITVQENENIFFRIYGWGADSQLGRFYVRNFTIEEVDPDIEPPQLPTITNTSGNPTNNQSPNFELSASDNIEVTQMQFSCDGINFSDWEDYNENKIGFDLKSDLYGCENKDGNKEVFVKFRDAALNESTITGTGIFTLDTTKPELTTVTAVPSLTNNDTPSYTFNSTEDGIISYSGDCSDSVTEAISGENTVTFNTLIDGTHSNCQITVTDIVGNISTPLLVSSFEIDTQAPQLIHTDSISSNSTPTWAKSGDQVTYYLEFSEDVKLNAKSSNTTAENATKLVQDINFVEFINTGEIVFQVENGDNGNISIKSAAFEIVDQAGNVANITEDNFVENMIIADTTAPTISGTSIYSNNSLDTSLAKTNDTISVEFKVNDNLSSIAFLEDEAMILNKDITHNSGLIAELQSIERFTDGSESSEIIVPFSFSFSDEAGNVSNIKTATDDSSSVRFDHTNPLIRNIEISATSADNTAYLGDAPIYYAKQGDSIGLNFQTCDYVDTNNNAPRGTLFNQSVTAIDNGLTDENCVTSGGQNGTWRQWEISLNNADGLEGVITFDVEVYDNAGNNETEILHVTGTTNGSQVFFDKTAPSLPTSVTDKLGTETTDFKHHSNAIYTWTGQQDLMAGVYYAEVNLVNSDAGYSEMAQIFSPENSHDFELQRVLPSTNTDYIFNISVTDKAGNGTDFENLYQQKYTVNLFGQVLDKNGQPIPSATIQVTSEEDFCNKLFTPCSILTDKNGEYSILLQGNTDYDVNIFASSYSQDQQTIQIKTTDTEKDFILDIIQNNPQPQTEILSIPENSSAGNGKADLRMRGEYRELSILGRKEPISYEESMALAKKANEGTPASLAYYINRNGYKIFAGYVSGKLPLDKVGARAQNQIVYRGEKHWQVPKLTPPNYVAEKLEIAKDLFQRNEEKEKSQFSANGLRKLIRPRAGDEAVRHLMRMEVVNNNINKFERRGEISPYNAVSRIDTKKDMNLIKFMVGGKSFSMADYLQN